MGSKRGFNSPNEENTLVVDEKSFLLSGYTDFYIKENFLCIKRLGQCISTDDGYRPFSSEDYLLNWIDETKRKYGKYGKCGIIG